MKPKLIVKILVDIGMTVTLLLLMSYSLIGEAAHEWIGMGMFVLFIVHHILNIQWFKNIFKGKYTTFRTVQTLIVVLILVCMIGSMVSGIILSRHALDFLPIEGGTSIARTVHMLAAYWGFVLMSVHLGFHWGMMMGMAKKMVQKPSAVCTWVLRIIALTIACYGAYAFVIRQIGTYMFLKNQFVFFNFDEPRIFFFIDYVAVMGLFVCIGHYLSLLLKKIDTKNNSK